LDGVNDFVELGNPASLQLTGSMTVSAWVNSAAFPRDDAAIVSKRTLGEVGYQLDTTIDRGPRTIGFKLTTSAGGSMFRYGATTLQANSWYYVTGVYDAATSQLHVYLNGQLDDGSLVGTVGATQQNSSANVNIGGRPGTTNYNFNGRIDDVRIYNRALTAGEIQSDLSTPVGGGTGDSTPPTAPTGVSATATSPTQINLSWAAATDNVAVTGYRVERCQGAGCSSWAEIAQPTGTTYSDSGRIASTTYSYRVRAVDAAGNLGPYSATASATTPAETDSQPPTAPTGLSATATSSTQINLSWSAATDNVAVAGYRVERCQGSLCSNFAEVAQPSGTSYSDIGRTASTSYSYRVRAVDAAGNLSPYSGTATATTQAPTPNLLAAYAFNEGSGTSAVDASGSGLTGTLTNGVTWGIGHAAGAVSLDGVNDFVELGNPALLQLTGSMTVSAWVNSAAFPRDDAAIVSKRSSSKIGYQLDTTIDRGPRTIGFKLTSSAGRDMFRYGATTLQANTWYFVTGVYSAATSELHVYLNGQLNDGALVGTVSATQQNSTANVNIGRRPASNNYNFNGRIDDVRIYNRALTAGEIQSDMNRPVVPGV